MATVYATPRLLRGAITANAALPGPQGLDESLMLVNTDRSPMVVTGLRFYAFSPQTFVRLRIGNDYMTQGFVPLALIGSPLDRTASLSGGWSWTLPFPTFLRPQERITVEAGEYDLATRTLLPLTATTVMEIGVVGYAGTADVVTPGVRHVPYAASWVAPEGNHTVFSAYSGESNEADLGNPFDRPMFAERIGATLFGRAGAVQAIWDNQAPGGSATAIIAVNARLEDSLGHLLTPSPVPLCNLMDSLRGAWMVRTWLPPKHFFIARLTGGDGYGGSGGGPYYFTPMLGIVGSRQERI